MIQKIKLVIIGAGGHAKACLDLASRISNIEVVGMIDNKINHGMKVNGVEVLGTDLIIPELIDKKYQFTIGIGQIKTSLARIKMYEYLISMNARIFNLIANSAILSKSVELGSGITIMEGAKIGPNVILGNGVIINTNAVIEHGSIISDFCHVSTSAVVNGDCKVGSNTFIGSGTVIKQSISISSNNVIEMGSRVFHDV